MSLLEEIRTNLRDLVAALSNLNSQNRKELRETILLLEHEIDRSIVLCNLYIDGAARIKPKSELIDYLSMAPQTLLDSFNQYKICAGLYDLEDRFKMIFSTLRGSIAVGSMSKISGFVGNLAQGERFVIDGVRDLTEIMAEAGRDLSSLSGAAFEDRRGQLLLQLELERKELSGQMKLLRQTVRDIIKRM
jgi:hypothetical protein